MHNHIILKVAISTSRTIAWLLTNYESVREEKDTWRSEVSFFLSNLSETDD